MNILIKVFLKIYKYKYICNLSFSLSLSLCLAGMLPTQYILVLEKNRVNRVKRCQYVSSAVHEISCLGILGSTAFGTSIWQ